MKEERSKAERVGTVRGKVHEFCDEAMSVHSQNSDSNIDQTMHCDIADDRRKSNGIPPNANFRGCVQKGDGSLEEAEFAVANQRPEEGSSFL